MRITNELYITIETTFQIKYFGSQPSFRDEEISNISIAKDIINNISKIM